MADTAMTIETQVDNAFRAINTLAMEVQSRASEVAHLIAAIDNSSDDLCCGGEVVGDTQLVAIDRIIVFCRLAREATQRAADLGSGPNNGLSLAA